MVIYIHSMEKRDLCLQRFWEVLWLVLSGRSNNWAQWSCWCYSPWIYNELHYANNSSPHSNGFCCLQMASNGFQWLPMASNGSKPIWTGVEFTQTFPLSLLLPNLANWIVLGRFRISLPMDFLKANQWVCPGSAEQSPCAELCQAWHRLWTMMGNVVRAKGQQKSASSAF